MRNKCLSYLFAAMSILLSNVMCVTTAYNYCSMQWCEQYAGCSAPARFAFLLIIPFAFAIVGSIIGVKNSADSAAPLSLQISIAICAVINAVTAVK